MPFVTIPNRPSGGDIRAIEQILADFDAITEVINGNLDATNFVSGPSVIFFPGLIMAYGGATAPAGWLMCNGQPVSRTQYSGLYAAIGTAYGAGDGSTTFNVPNMIGSIPIGADPGGSVLISNHPSVGWHGGTENAVVSVAQMPAHGHGTYMSVEGSSFAWATGPNGGLLWSSVQASGGNTPGFFSPPVHTTTGSYWDELLVSNTGGGQPHNNLQPSVAVSYIIKS